MIYIGDQKLKSCYLGDEKIKKVYRGDDLLFAQKPTHNLPQGYTELEYVEATGAQYISGIYTQSVRVFAVDFESTKAGSSSRYLWGGTSYGTSMNPAYLTYTSLSSTTADSITSVFGRSGSTKISLPEKLFEKRTYIKQDRNNGKLTVNDEIYDVTVSTVSSIKSAFFGYGYTNQSSVTTYYGSACGKIYSWQVSGSTDGELMYNCIPCVQDATGIAGFYDIKANVFRKSASTTNFVAGPVL